jgi:DNA-directed RNA polymerase alpha subunit
MQFTQHQRKDARTHTFTLVNSHVTYANTLRRLILTGVETIAFRSDMTSTGTTTDVAVIRNDTPMTNEMLADRIGLIPIHVKDPQNWKPDQYQFILRVHGDKERVRYVRAGDFEVRDLLAAAPVAPVGAEAGAEAVEAAAETEGVQVDTARFFPPSPLTGDTCLIASLAPGSGPTEQAVELLAKATKGTGREHARFSPVSQCSYEYTLDRDPARISEMFTAWLQSAKKVGAIDKASDRYAELQREFNTMQIKRCFMVDEKGEPYSFDFTVESVGVLDVEYIVRRACEVGENICLRYVNLDKGVETPDDLSISTADTRVIGFDFLFRGHDHTLGNLFQTWMSENLMTDQLQQGQDDNGVRVTYVGYSVPHPLRDEMILRVGVADAKESTARAAVATAARGCRAMFQSMREAWEMAVGGVAQTSVVKRPRPKVPGQQVTVQKVG